MKADKYAEDENKQEINLTKPKWIVREDGSLQGYPQYSCTASSFSPDDFKELVEEL